MDEMFVYLDELGPHFRPHAQVGKTFTEIVDGVTAHRAYIDELLGSYSMGWSLERMPAGSPENIEAITAFIEKRAPDFSKFR